MVENMVTETPALSNLRAMLDDVDSLLAYHPEADRPVQATGPDTTGDPLLRSCVSLVYTAWEVYVEESLIWAVGMLVERGDPSKLPDRLRAWVSEKMLGETPDVWQLAGDGWRAVTMKLVTDHVRGDGSARYGLNTASPEKVMELHKNLLGKQPLNNISWQGRPNKSVKRELALLVSVRGEIVHKGVTPGTLNLIGTQDWRDFMLRTCVRLDRQIVETVEP